MPPEALCGHGAVSGSAGACPEGGGGRRAHVGHGGRTPAGRRTYLRMNETTPSPSPAQATTKEEFTTALTTAGHAPESHYEGEDGVRLRGPHVRTHLDERGPDGRRPSLLPLHPRGAARLRPACVPRVTHQGEGLCETRRPPSARWSVPLAAARIVSGHLADET